jgi:hypothetical protein
MQLRKLVALIGVLAVIAACVASAGPSRAQRSPSPASCTWGISSITASYVDGQVVESTPETAGCTSDS